MPSIASIVDEHAEEAARLARARAAASRSPAVTLAALGQLDARLAAHLVGLRRAGPSAWSSVAAALAPDRPENVFVAAVLALEVCAFERLAALLDKVGPLSKIADGLAAAIGWLRWDDVELTLEALLAEGGPPELAAIGLGGAVHHTFDPGGAIAAGLASAHTGLARAALLAAGALGRVDLLPVVRERIDGMDSDERWAAAWAGALLGAREGRVALGRIACEGGPRAEEALEVAIRSGAGDDGPDLVQAVAARDGGERATLIGMAALGDRGAVEALLVGLGDPALARIAAYGVETVTGLSLRSGRLSASAGVDGALDEAEEDVGLPWPDPVRLAAAARALSVPDGARWFDGRPPSEPSLHALINRADAPNLRRRSAALELVAVTRGRPLVDIARRARRAASITRRTG